MKKPEPTTVTAVKEKAHKLLPHFQDVFGQHTKLEKVLELLSKIDNHKDWNTYRAALVKEAMEKEAKASETPPVPEPMITLADLRSQIAEAKKSGQPLPKWVPPVPRPTLTDDIVAMAAKKTVEQLDDWNNPDTTEEVTRLLIENYSRGASGFDLASNLQFELPFGCNIDDDWVDILGGMDWDVRDELEKRVTDWVKENNIRPPYPVGTMTTRGVISHIPGEYKNLAEYLVQDEAFRKRNVGHTERSGYVVKYEDVELVWDQPEK